MIGMHLQNPANPFFFSFCRIVHIGSAGHLSGVNPEERQFADIRIRHDFKGQRGKRRRIIGIAVFFDLRIRIDPLNRWNVRWRRQIIDNRIKKRLNPLVPIRGSTKHRCHLTGNRRQTNPLHDFFFCQFFAFEVFHHQFIIAFRHGVQQILMIQLSLLFQLFRDFRHFARLAQVVFIDNGLHIDQINHAFIRIFRADRQLHRDRIGA